MFLTCRDVELEDEVESDSDDDMEDDDGRF